MKYELTLKSGREMVRETIYGDLTEEKRIEIWKQILDLFSKIGKRE